ncbi:hypothetical protein IEQ34_012271 [Dendrobium chrysotoxum]|uniref:Uncharacterized protein n=1 Tax=Dendrobium chrysotoxum TaxID=161865 RepID=A0AAV7GTI1_DENCH|nr:hypothetical protein IEQ34_012271 [Dendrobium chrysotoxum]
MSSRGEQNQNYLSFGSKLSHEGCSGITGVVLFDERNGGVNHKKGNNSNKVLPIWVLPPGCNSDDGCCLHHPRKRIPHETKELEKFALLLKNKRS